MTDLARTAVSEYLFADAPADEPAVKELIGGYMEMFGFPKDTPTTADRWHTVTHKGEVVAVLGEKAHADMRVLEITDLYSARGRKGTLALYAIMELFKHFVDSGQIETIAWATYGKNKGFQRAVERVFDMGPRTVIYAYGKDY